MIPETPELQVVVQRLEKIEKQHRRFKAAGIVVLLLVSATLFMGQAGPKSRIIEARKVLLHDANGRVRVALDAFFGAPSLLFYDKEGVIRLGLGVVPNSGPALDLYDANGDVRLGLSVLKSGPAFDLYDASGKVIFSKP